MKAAAVEAADAIVRQASQEAAAQREADAARHAQMQQAEQQAAQIVEAARREAVDEAVDPGRVRREARPGRDRRRYLGGVLELLGTLDAELSDRAGRPLRRRRSARRRIAVGRLRAEV